jgi:type IV pilus assembly protein PilX
MNNQAIVRIRHSSLQASAGKCRKILRFSKHEQLKPAAFITSSKYFNRNYVLLHSPASRQSGVVLVISLIMLMLLTLMATTGMQTTSLEEKMAGNMRDKDLAFQAAESAINAGEAMLLPTPPVFDVSGTSNSGTGFYTSASNIPTAAAVLTDTFWTTNPVATYSHIGFFNITADSKYIIQDIGVADCPGAAVGSLGCHNFRITARATGASTNTVVILQTIFSTS